MIKNTDIYIVNVNDNVYSALEVMEKNETGTVIVVDDFRKVVGTLTDGDIRKLLLEHRMLTTPVREVMNLAYKYINSEDNMSESHLFSQFPSLRLIPCIDGSGLLLGVRKRKSIYA